MCRLQLYFESIMRGQFVDLVMLNSHIDWFNAINEQKKQKLNKIDEFGYKISLQHARLIDSFSTAYQFFAGLFKARKYI